MKHKLLLINLLLIGLVAASGSVLRQKWLASRVHEETVLKQKAPVAPALVIAPIPSPQPAAPAAYNEVAQKLLTARDRNPNIFIEPPKVEEKVMPPLPFQYGIIDFGAGPTVMLAEKAGAAQHGYHIGDKIGPFKLLGVNRTDILFEWDGKPVQRKLSDLVDKSAATAAAAAATTDINKSGAPAPATLAPKPMAPVEAKPGVSVGNDIKACLPGDASPAGTIADGMKKLVTATPFGQSCRWEPVK